MLILHIHIIIVKNFSPNWQKTVSIYEKAFHPHIVHKHFVEEEQYIPVTCSLILDTKMVDGILILAGKYNNLINQELLHLSADALMPIDYRYEEIQGKPSKLVKTIELIIDIFNKYMPKDDLDDEYDDDYIEEYAEEDETLFDNQITKNKKNIN